MSGNILIIDDSPVDRKIIRNVLTKRIPDLNIHEAESGEAASQVLNNNNISVCILDIIMSGKNGFQILEEIKQSNQFADIPVIVCTGLRDSNTIETALSLGAYDYFKKPLSEEAMKVSLPLKVKNAIEFKLRNDNIVYLSYHDKLTGFYNRRYYEEEMERLKNSDHLPISIIIGDVNGLKLTNDAYGHEAGDHLLVDVSNILREVLNQNDNLFRIGGDEFLIILPNASKKDAERVASIVKARCSEAEGAPVKPSIALGIATKENPEQSLNEVYKLAEDMMYSDKLMNSSNVKDSIILSLRNTLREWKQDNE